MKKTAIALFDLQEGRNSEFTLEAFIIMKAAIAATNESSHEIERH